MISIAIQPQESLSQCPAIVKSRSRWLGESFVSLRKARKILRRTITDGVQNQAMQRTRDKVGRCGSRKVASRLSQTFARGYLLKTIHHEELAAAIRKVHHGEVVTAAIGQPQPKPTGGLISQRELEVLGLIRQGFSNDEIARLLGISERTVRAHVTPDKTGS